MLSEVIVVREYNAFDFCKDYPEAAWIILICLVLATIYHILFK